MANNCVIYATESQNGFRRCYSSTTTTSTATTTSSSLSHCSSMGMVYADMSSLSLSSRDSSYISKRSEVESGRAFWGFPFTGNCITRNSFEEHNDDEALEGTKGSDSSDGNGENNDACKANFDDDNHSDQNVVNTGKETDSGHSKLCARGHWRPAEDSKLKELVALYGPQNWNLIAEKLEGRSGKKVKKYLIFICIYILYYEIVF